MLTKDSFTLSDSQTEIDDSTSSLGLLAQQNQSKQSVTVESHPPSNETTLLDKSSECEVSIQTQKSFQTSAQVSTSKEKPFLPYWNDSCKERSSDLFLPTGTGSVVSASNFSSTCSKSLAAKSWFSTRQWESQNKSLYKTYLQSCTTSHAECTEAEVVKTVRVRKIRLYPNPQQKQLFKHWFGTSRKTYNETVAYLNSETKPKAHWMAQSKPILASLPEWATAVPYQIKKMAVSDAYKAWSNGCSKAKKTKQAFSLKFRSKKDPKQSCFIPSSAIKKGAIYVNKAGELKMSEQPPGNPKDSRLIYQNGRWFLAVPYEVEVTKTENKGRIVAIDPGVRTFATLFSEDAATKIGEYAIARIHRLCQRVDKFISKAALVKARERRSIRKKLHRLKWKIWDLVDELHHKTIKHLTDCFDTILLPTFETSQMVGISARKIRSKTARQMLTLSHFKFKQRLKSKAQALGKTVLDVCEAYTSKTASWTGDIVRVGSSKTIKSQGLVLDRDINGARGIFLRALGDNPSLKRELCYGLR